MSFYGTSFSFDGISCEEFGLMLYDLDSSTQGESSWATGTKIKEERIPGRVRSIYYGKTEESNLEFTLIFGADEHAARAGEPIDRYEMQAIAWWLTGPDDYRYLQIDQPDMAGLRYRCIITDLKMIEPHGKKWAFSCKVHCDSPYAYTFPQTYKYPLTKGLSRMGTLVNPSTVNDLYYPKIAIALSGGTSFSIRNLSTNTSMTFDGLPQTPATLEIDCQNGIILESSGLNMYPYYNNTQTLNRFSFLSLLPGSNALSIRSSDCVGTITFECEFPMNVGG